MNASTAALGIEKERPHFKPYFQVRCRASSTCTTEDRMSTISSTKTKQTRRMHNEIEPTEIPSPSLANTSCKSFSKTENKSVLLGEPWAIPSSSSIDSDSRSFSFRRKRMQEYSARASAALRGSIPHFLHTSRSLCQMPSLHALSNALETSRSTRYVGTPTRSLSTQVMMNASLSAL